MVPAGYFLLVIFSNYFTVKRGNLAYFSSFLSLLKSNLKKSLIGSTQLGPFWIAIMNLYIKSFQKIYIFWECLIFCLNQTLACCAQIIALFRILRARCGGQKRVPKLSDDCFPMLIQFGQEREMSRSTRRRRNSPRFFLFIPNALLMLDCNHFFLQLHFFFLSVGSSASLVSKG